VSKILASLFGALIDVTSDCRSDTEDTLLAAFLCRNKLH
jgi:hypothetical protein